MAARPVLPPCLDFEWKSFWRLSTDRPSGFGVGRIPFGAIAAYGERFGIVGVDAMDRFADLIMAMDRAFVGRVAKHERRNRKPKG